jgi:hypothetical protein
MTGLRKQRDEAFKEYERVNHILDIIKRRCVDLKNATTLDDMFNGIDAIQVICECALDGMALPAIATKLEELENERNSS